VPSTGRRPQQPAALRFSWLAASRDWRRMSTTSLPRFLDTMSIGTASPAETVGAAQAGQRSGVFALAALDFRAIRVTFTHGAHRLTDRTAGAGR
jgi:hypothetical protein